MKSYRSRSRRRMSELLTCASEFLLLPTPLAHDAKSGKRHTEPTQTAGLNVMAERGLLPTPLAMDARNLGAPSHMRRDTIALGAMAAHGMLPTPTASEATRGRSPVVASRQVEGRNSPDLSDLAAHGMLPTPTATANMLSPSMRKWPVHRRLDNLLPTPTASSYGTSGNGDPGDGRGQYAHKGTPSLTTMAKQGKLPAPEETNSSPKRGKGGRLSAQFVEWMMGFSLDWTRTYPAVPEVSVPED